MRSNRMIFAALFLLGGAAALPGSTISITGTMAAPNDLFTQVFVLTQVSRIDIQTWGYGGGTNAGGVVIPAGGFDPIVALYLGSDASATLLNYNDDGTCPPANPDSVSGLCLDSSLSQNGLLPGTYMLALTVSANLPLGPTFDYGFAGGGDFVDILGYERTSAFAVDIEVTPAGTPVAETPEPNLVPLAAGCLLAMCLWRRRLPRRLGLTCLIVCAPWMAYSQSPPNLIVNGSFEADPCVNSLNNGSYRSGTKGPLVGNDVTGWYIPASGDGHPWCLQNNNGYNLPITPNSRVGPTPYGNQWLVLGYFYTNTSYSIQQTINGLSPGTTYKVSFAISSQGGCCSVAEVSFLNGSSTPAQIFTAPAAPAVPPEHQDWVVWATKTMNFTATSSSATIQFRNLVTAQPPFTTVPPFVYNGADLGLDNVVIEGPPAIQITLDSPPENNKYLIASAGSMPVIQASAAVLHVDPDPTEDTTFTWTAELRINQKDGNPKTCKDAAEVSYDDDLVQSGTTVGTAPFLLAFRDPSVLRGGRLKLKVSAKVNGKTVNAQTPDDLDPSGAALLIYGTNPQRASIQSAVSSGLAGRSFYGLQAGDVGDVMKRIGCRESWQRQFDAAENGGSGLPLISCDNGIGIYQITDPSLFKTQPALLFDWRENVKKGISTYQEKVKWTLPYPKDLRAAVYYQNFINNISQQRVAAGRQPIPGYPAPNFTTAGLLGSAPVNQLLEDALRGYNGYSGPPPFGSHTLHEFMPDADFLLNVPDNQLSTLATNPLVWKRVCWGNCLAVRGKSGDPEYVMNVTARAAQCGN